MIIIKSKKTENTYHDNERMEHLSKIYEKLNTLLMGYGLIQGVHDFEPCCGAEKEEKEKLVDLMIKTLAQVERMNRGYLARDRRAKNEKLI